MLPELLIRDDTVIVIVHSREVILPSCSDVLLLSDPVVMVCIELVEMLLKPLVNEPWDPLHAIIRILVLFEVQRAILVGVCIPEILLCDCFVEPWTDVLQKLVCTHLAVSVLVHYHCRLLCTSGHVRNGL